MSNLVGLHDIEGTAIAPPDTWLIDTVALSDYPQPMAYPTNQHVITRLNWAYGSGGTLPLPSVYEAFAELVAQYVNGCSGCSRWQIGNEPNLSREWPDNTSIYPWHYAACYKLCRQAIHALPGHEADEVLVAGSGPWNDELKYSDNPTGDWITYFSQVIDLLGNELDGFAIHAYTHGYDAVLVPSTARMAAPFENRCYEFRTYVDYCNAIPDRLNHLPCYITEANGNGPWQAVGLMPAMLTEINDWNYFGGLPLIQCVAFYRYPHYDDFYIEGRADVIAEYQAAVAKGYSSPMPVPPWPEPAPAPPEPEPEMLDWDERLTVRGCTLQKALVAPGEMTRALRIGRWFDEQEAEGRVNIYVRILDENGQLAVGVPVTQFWSSGADTKYTERKSDPWLASKGLGADYSLDFAMYNVAPSYGIRINDSHSNDLIDGCGLGSIEQPDYKIHTAYFFEWQLSSGGITVPDPPILPPPPLTGHLIWPVSGPVTQYFGEGGPSFGQPGHGGIDIAVVEGTPVVAIADGEVMYTGNDQNYGNYVRVWHPSIHSHSFYAHLAQVDVEVGDRVKQGDEVAKSGNTGNSTGDHLHYELRSGTRDAYYEGVTYGYTHGRYNPVDAYIVTGSPLSPGVGL